MHEESLLRMLDLLPQIEGMSNEFKTAVAEWFYSCYSKAVLGFKLPILAEKTTASDCLRFDAIRLIRL
jgi:hypothetical protein